MFRMLLRQHIHNYIRDLKLYDARLFRFPESSLSKFSIQGPSFSDSVDDPSGLLA